MTQINPAALDQAVREALEWRAARMGWLIERFYARIWKCMEKGQLAPLSDDFVRRIGHRYREIIASMQISH